MQWRMVKPIPRNDSVFPLGNPEIPFGSYLVLKFIIPEDEARMHHIELRCFPEALPGMSYMREWMDTTLGKPGKL